MQGAGCEKFRIQPLEVVPLPGRPAGWQSDNCDELQYPSTSASAPPETEGMSHAQDVASSQPANVVRPCKLQARRSNRSIQSMGSSLSCASRQEKERGTSDEEAEGEEIWCGSTQGQGSVRGSARGSTQLDFHTMLKCLGELHDHEVAELRLETQRLTGIQTLYKLAPHRVTSGSPMLKHVRSGGEGDAHDPVRSASAQPSRRMSALERLRDLQQVCQGHSRNIEAAPEKSRKPLPDESAASQLKIGVVPPQASSATEELDPMKRGGQALAKGFSRKMSISEMPANSRRASLAVLVEDTDKKEIRSTATSETPMIQADNDSDSVEKSVCDFEVSMAWKPDAKKSFQRSNTFARRPTLHQNNLPKAQFSSNVLEMTSNGFLQQLVVHPSSPKRLAWDLLSMTLLAYDIIVIPFVGAFDPPSDAFMVAMTWFTLIFWTCDILMTMLTGYYSGKTMVLCPKKVFVHYMSTWMLLDLIIVSLDWTLVILEPGEDAGGAGSAARLGRTLRTLRFIRTLRLIRALKLKKLVQTIQDLINTETVSILFGITKIILSLCIANHIVACCWYSIGNFGGQDASWVTAAGLENRTLLYRYMTSLHWSLTQFTPASMEVVPVTCGERIFSVVILLIAMVSFSSFVSILSASMAELKKISSDESRQFWLLRRYLRDWGVRREVSLRIQRYLEYAYQKQRQRVQEQDVALLHLLSKPLHEDLTVETFSQKLSQHPLFEKCAEQLRIFGSALEAMSLASGDQLFSCGELSSKVFFLTSGVLEYTLGELGDAIEDIYTPRVRTSFVNEGSWVGEAVLWTLWLHLGDLQAMTESQIVTIDAAAFGTTVQNNRPLWLMVHRYALRFVEELNLVKREELTDLTDLLFPPPATDDYLGRTDSGRSLDQGDREGNLRTSQSFQPDGSDSAACGFFKAARRASQLLMNGGPTSAVTADREARGGSSEDLEGVMPIEAVNRTSS